jgi:histidine ammonia-lyase
MGMTTTQKTRQIMENCFGVLAIEMIASCQALDIRDATPGKGTAIAHKFIRQQIDHLDDDRPLFPDHETMVEILQSGSMLNAVENEIGTIN